ncbi:MAG: GspE/PulE family protein [bacterium]|nr:GspE/PulE family protein [bacterium]
MKDKIKNELNKGENISIINLVSYLIEHSRVIGASDIHIDPTETAVKVRLRIDGVLHDGFSFPKQIDSEVISRIKVLSGLRTDEHQMAQDGRFRALFQDAEPVDIRVSIAPAYHGENAVLRLLSDRAEKLDLEGLGFSEGDREKINKAIQKPYGMILATGPTGSGKTTTLYTLIKSLNSKENSIITIEDPVEYAIDDIRQIQVNSRTGLTFANGLRSILRQDPNVIMVGEIRDIETASIAVNTALTGHLLLSTIHTSDAATTLPRLLDMKIEPYLIASTINLAIGQRLVRKICQNCKTERNITDAEKLSIESALKIEPTNIYKNIFYGKGCDSCSGSGFKGRVVIAEVIDVDNDIRDAILRKASATEIKKIAMKNGMISMTEEGLRKVVKGETTIEEILRVVHE